MNYLNTLSVQLSIELVSHVLLLTLSGVLITRAFGVGKLCSDGVTRAPLTMIGGGLLYSTAIVLSFFVDQHNSHTYSLFLALFLVCIFGSYLLLFMSIVGHLEKKQITTYYFVTLFFGIIYTAIAVAQFTSPNNELLLYYVISELLGTVFLFMFIHAYLARGLHSHD